MSTPVCTQCHSALEPGFVADFGQGATGYAKWVQGPLEQGFLGGAKLMGRPKFAVDAYRCTGCGHLELYASRQV